MDRREYDELSTSEKILRLQEMWDEIGSSPEEIELTPEQLEDLDRRLEDHRRNPRPTTPWEELRKELEDYCSDPD